MTSYQMEVILKGRIGFRAILRWWKKHSTRVGLSTNAVIWINDASTSIIKIIFSAWNNADTRSNYSCY